VIALGVFLLTSKSGPPAVYAPNLLSLTYTQAQAIAESDGLSITFTTRTNNTKQPDNTVIERPDRRQPDAQGRHRSPSWC